MVENIFCKNCGKELPPESTFCPYCMTKFTKETVTEQELEKRSSKKIPIIIVTLAVLIAFAVGIVLLVPVNDDAELSKQSETVTYESETSVSKSENFTESTLINEENKKEKILSVSDNGIGFSLYGDMKKLSGERGLVADYFGSAFMTVSYESLKEDIYINSKIKFNGIVIEKTEEYLVVEYGASAGFDGMYESTGNMVTVILSDMTNMNITDSLAFYGEYRGMKNITINDEKINVPQFSATRYTEYVYEDVEMPLYTESEIAAIAKTIFGNDTVVREAKNSDFESTIGDVEINRGMYYTAITEDSKYCFYTGESRYIYDCDSTFSNETYILPTAYFKGYYRLTSFENENKSTFEMIDTKGKRCWQREFKHSDLPVIDYTTEKIYIVSDAMIYILDAKTGQDIVRPKYVGEKCDIKKIEDGIILLAYDRSKALMKTDLSGNVIWTSSVSFNLSDSVSGESIPILQKSGDNFIVSCEAFEDSGFSVGKYTAVISNNGKVVFEDK